MSVAPRSGNIARRIGVAFAVLLAMFVGAAALALAALHELHQALHAVEEDTVRMRSAFKLASAVRDQYAHMAHTIIIGDDSHRALYEEAAARVSATSAEVSGRARDASEAALVARIRQASASLDTTFRQSLLPALRAGDTEQPRALHPDILERVSDAQEAADQLAALGESSISRFGAHAQLVQHRTMVWLLCFLVVALLCAGGVAVYLHRSIARPVAALAGGAARIGAGDLDVRLDVASDGELGRLAHQFNLMAAAVKEQQARLVQQEKAALVGRLAAGLAHEINNPLAVILGYLKLLRRTGGPPSRELSIIEEEAERCREIVEDLLDLTRQERQERLEQVDLRALCETSLERLRVSTGRTDLVVNLSGEGTVMGSAKRLGQAVHNLIKNAVEAASAGGRVDVTIAPGAPGCLTLTVADDGPGIGSHERQFVFEPFFTTKPSGTGLGLAVSRAIARSHGGDLELLSDGPHARFRMSLPVDQGRTAA